MGARIRVLLVLAAMAATACGASAHIEHQVAATSYVPWAPLEPGRQIIQASTVPPVPPFPIPPGTPACRAADLEGLTAHGAGATGNVNMPIAFRNRGAADCVVAGYPGVTVRDEAGRVLASATGAAGAGTYFDDGPVVPILARAGTPPLTRGAWDATRQGQLFINLSWYDCRRPSASTLAVDLPGGGGRLTVRFQQQAAYYALCDTNPHYASLARGPFSPVGIQWPPDLHRYIATSVSITAPGPVKAGTALVFYVTVTNRDTIDYVLDPCPDYLVFLGPKTVVWQFMLNCAPAGRVRAGASQLFEMRLDVPKDTAPGDYSLDWSLVDFRITSTAAVGHVQVTG